MSDPKRAFTDSAFDLVHAPRRTETYVDDDTHARLTNMSMRVRQSLSQGYKTTPTSFTLSPPSFPSYTPSGSSSSTATLASTTSTASSTNLTYLSDSTARATAAASFPSDSMDTTSDQTKRRRRSPSPGADQLMPMGPPLTGTSGSLLANRPKRMLRATQSMPVRSGGGTGAGWIGEMGREQRDREREREGENGMGPGGTGEWRKFQFESFAKREEGF